MGVHTGDHCANGDTRWWGYTPVITVLMETPGGGVHTGDHCANGDTRWWGDTPVITVLMETPGGGGTHR